ncbi:MAG: FecR family protein [Sphingobium sp.]
MDRSSAKSRTLDEAARWYARLHSAAMSSHEQAMFDAWKSASPENDAAWTAMQTTHDQAERLAVLPEMAAIRGQALEESGRSFPAWRIAASLALLLTGAAGVYGLLNHWQQSTVVASAEPLLYETAVGERRTIALADGSRVTLNTDSVIRLPAWTSRREIELVRGEAYFRVAKDKAHPFIVETDKANVRAIGTAFSVRRMDKGFRVALAEGKVQVSVPASNRTETLEPGQQLFVDGNIIRRSASGAAQANGWLSGELTFRDESLADAVAEMNRYSTRKIVLRESSAGYRKLSGVFKAGDVDTFVRAITAYGMAKIESEDAEIIRLKGM